MMVTIVQCDRNLHPSPLRVVVAESAVQVCSTMERVKEGQE